MMIIEDDEDEYDSSVSALYKTHDKTTAYDSTDSELNSSSSSVLDSTNNSSNSTSNNANGSEDNDTYHPSIDLDSYYAGEPSDDSNNGTG